MSQELNEILSDRESVHGSALKNFTAIGRMWGALLDIEDIPPHVVALMYDAGKSVRAVANQFHEDNWLDKQGYTQHGMEIANES
jgi:hypothetical protein